MKKFVDCFCYSGFSIGVLFSIILFSEFNLFYAITFGLFISLISIVIYIGFYDSKANLKFIRSIIWGNLIFLAWLIWAYKYNFYL